MDNRLVVGIVGPIASGKGVVADVLKNKGFCVYSLSDRIRESLEDQDISNTRKNLHDEGNRLRKKYGNKVLAERTVEMIKEEDCSKVVIESIRNYHEVDYLKDELNVIIIAVDAPAKKRFGLLKRRSREGDPNTFEEFKEIDDKEVDSRKAHTQNINMAIRKADYVIKNTGSLNDLKSKVEDLIDDLESI